MVAVIPQWASSQLTSFLSEPYSQPLRPPLGILSQKPQVAVSLWSLASHLGLEDKAKPLFLAPSSFSSCPIQRGECWQRTSVTASPTA